MSRQQSYIVRLLRQMDLPDHNGVRSPGVSLGGIIQTISQADDVQQALEMLYAVQGFDAFALRLMWCLERNGVAYADPGGEVIEYEVSGLGTTLSASSNGGFNHDHTVDIPDQALDEFYDKLHSFGRAIEGMKRKSLQDEPFKSLESELLYRVLSDVEALGIASQTIGKEEVSRFAESVKTFLQHVVDNNKWSDRRVVHVLDHANLTLQTVMETVGTEEYQSIVEITAMLNAPEELLT